MTAVSRRDRDTERLRAVARLLHRTSLGWLAVALFVATLAVQGTAAMAPLAVAASVVITVDIAATWTALAIDRRCGDERR